MDGGSDKPLAQCMLLVEMAQPETSGDCQGYDVFRKKYRPRLAHRWALDTGVDEVFEVDKFAEMAFPMGVPIRPSWRAPSYMAFALTLGAGERLHAHCLYHWALVPRRSLSLFRMQLTIPLYSAGEEDPTLLDDVLHLPVYAPQCLCIVTSHPHHLTFKAILHRIARELPQRGPVDPELPAVAALWQELTSPLTRPMEALPPVLRVREMLFRFPRRSPHTWMRAGRTPGEPRAWPRRARRCSRCGEPESTAMTEVSVPRARALRAVAAGIVRPGALQEEGSGEVDSVWVRTETRCPLGMPSADVNFRLLAERLSPSTLVSCLGALLGEQQVVAVSAHTWVLHECLEAMVALLWPVGWPHTFIPVLPSDWMDILSAPIPYLIGTHADALPSPEALDTRPLVLDLDRGELHGDLVAPFPARLALRLFHAAATAQPLFVMSRPGVALAPVQLGEEAEEHALRVARELADRASAAAAATAASATVPSASPPRLRAMSPSPGSRSRGRGAEEGGSSKRHSARAVPPPPPPLSPVLPRSSTVPSPADPVDFRVVRILGPTGSDCGDDGLNQAYRAWREAEARRGTEQYKRQRRQRRQRRQQQLQVGETELGRRTEADFQGQKREEAAGDGGDGVWGETGARGYPAAAGEEGEGAQAVSDPVPAAHGGGGDDSWRGGGAGQGSLLAAGRGVASAAGGLRSALWRSGAAVRRSSRILRRSLLPAPSELGGGGGGRGGGVEEGKNRGGGEEAEEEEEEGEVREGQSGGEATLVVAPTATSPRDVAVPEATGRPPWQQRHRQRHRRRRQRQRRRRRRRRQRQWRAHTADDASDPNRPVSAPATISAASGGAEAGSRPVAGVHPSWLRTTAPRLTLRTLSLLESSDDEDDDEDGELWLRVADHQRALRAARVGEALAIGPSHPPPGCLSAPYRAAGHRRGASTLRPAAPLDGPGAQGGLRSGIVVDAVGRRQAEADLCDALLRRALRGRGLARLAGSADRESLLLRLVQGMGRMVAPGQVWGGAAPPASAGGDIQNVAASPEQATALSRTKIRWRSRVGLITHPEEQQQQQQQGQKGHGAAADDSPGGGGAMAPLEHGSSIMEAGNQVEHAGVAVSTLAAGGGGATAASGSHSASSACADSTSSFSDDSSSSGTDSNSSSGTDSTSAGAGHGQEGGSVQRGAAAASDCARSAGADATTSPTSIPASSDSSSFSSLLSSPSSLSEAGSGGGASDARPVRGGSECGPRAASTGLPPSVRPVMRGLRRQRQHRQWPFGRRGGLMAVAPAVKSLARELAGRSVEDLQTTSDEEQPRGNDGEGESDAVQRIRAVFGVSGEEGGGHSCDSPHGSGAAGSAEAPPPPPHRSLASWRTLHPSLSPNTMRLAVCGVLVSLLKAMHKYTRVPEALQREASGQQPVSHLAPVVEREEGGDEDGDGEEEEEDGVRSPTTTNSSPLSRRGVRLRARFSADTMPAADLFDSRTDPRALVQAFRKAGSGGHDAPCAGHELVDSPRAAVAVAVAAAAEEDEDQEEEGGEGVGSGENPLPPTDGHEPVSSGSLEPPTSSWLYGERSDGGDVDDVANVAVSEDGSGSSEDEPQVEAPREERPLSPVAVEDVVDKEKFLAEQVSADAERFMRHFLDTQLFSCFVQSRTEQKDCDFFDQWSFLKMQLKAARLHVLRSGTHAGLLYKAQRGTRHGWTRRWFVLEDLSIMYFAPNEALLKAEREAQRQREARSNSGDFDAAAYNRAMMAVNKERKAAQRGQFDIAEGRTRIQIPARRKLWPQFRTSHVLEVTKMNDAGEVVDTLCLCADTAEEHSAWLTLLRSRLHDSASMTELANLYLRGRPATLLSGRIRDYHSLARTNSISFGGRR